MRLQLLERLIYSGNNQYFISIASPVIGIKCNVHIVRAQMLSMCLQFKKKKRAFSTRTRYALLLTRSDLLHDLQRAVLQRTEPELSMLHSVPLSTPRSSSPPRFCLLFCKMLTKVTVTKLEISSSEVLLSDSGH